jgi:hypothetical protein
VRELKSGTASLSFSYRVVARRKDIAGPRLERVAAPPKQVQVALPQASDALPSSTSR